MLSTLKWNVSWTNVIKIRKSIPAFRWNNLWRWQINFDTTNIQRGEILESLSKLLVSINLHINDHEPADFLTSRYSVRIKNTYEESVVRLSWISCEKHICYFLPLHFGLSKSISLILNSWKTCLLKCQVLGAQKFT